MGITANDPAKITTRQSSWKAVWDDPIEESIAGSETSNRGRTAEIAAAHPSPAIRLSAPTDRFNQQNYFDFNATNPISSALGSTVLGAVVYNGVGGVGRGLYDPTKKDWAPR